MKTNIFRILSVTLVSTFAALFATAQDISVIDVRRNITLSDDDVIYKDFYLNAGDGSALRKNMVVNVRRKINVKDASTKSVGEFEAVVGQLKIIHVGSKVSVAREHKLIPRDEEPMLEQIGIMSGDRLDLKDSFIDNVRPAKKQKNTETKQPQKTDDTKTADASAVMSPIAPTPAVIPDNIREPAMQLNVAPEIQLPVTVPQI